ncbi:MAG: sigma-54-dependent Fis family transcriptional regulator [Gemmatimonadetes bacterium]|nr:sigma-54-dependent Fis family transcriptional regulator [Gemmatimonadota bacterium]
MHAAAHEGSVLVVDDEAGIRETLKQLLEYEGFRVRTAANADEALARFLEDPPDVVLLDVKMPRMDGMEALARLRVLDPDAMVVMVSGHANVASAVDAVKRGAYDFLEKPPDRDRVLTTVGNALRARRLVHENRQLKSRSRSESIVGSSAALKEVLERVGKVAPTRASVLLTGESGTGKEVLARAIHRMSERRRGPFVEVNCAAIPQELIESELFGHERGSFTGAHAQRKGKFELAHGGTLFLDEIGDMSASAQAKVLRALQEGVIERVGGNDLITVDVRVLAATNKNLEEEIGAGAFREDLYYRLNVVPLHVPSLRDRVEDIPLLAAHFLALYAQENNQPVKSLSPEGLALLERRAWPGNVRELKNAVERLAILSEGQTITLAEVLEIEPARGASGGAGTPSGSTFQEYKEAAERTFILRKLEENDWNVSETARKLDMPRSNLYKKIEKYGLRREDRAS